MYASSIKQKLLSRPAFETELNSLLLIIPQVMGIRRRLMMAQGYFVGVIKVWQDNMCSIAYVKKEISTPHRTKHIVVG